MKQTIVLALLLLTAALLAACGSQPSGSTNSQAEIVVDMSDIYFGDRSDNIDNPPQWTVTSGTEVTVRLENSGNLEHTWVILKAGEAVPSKFDAQQDSDKVLFATDIIPAGSSGKTTFTAPAPGEYQVLCTILGHSGIMQGRLIVTE